jgi:GDP-L-fucose synthase
MDKQARIYIAGHKGMVGSAIMRKLQNEAYSNIVTADRKRLDLTRQDETEAFFREEQPEYVFLAAARVGGIMANNTYRADFLYQNLQIQNNIIHSAYLNKVKKLLFLGSSCIYPKLSLQPIKEEYLLTGMLEYTNEPYAVAKIAGIKMCQAYHDQYGCNFISIMPSNLYGPNDNFDLNTSHALPALMRKFHEAVTNNNDHVEIWGSGEPRREFLHVDDLADACLFLMLNYNESEIINVGSGIDYSISELAKMMKDLSGFRGALRYNRDKPDGTFQKLLDVSKLNSLGFYASIPLKQGLEDVYQKEFLAQA